MGFESIQESEFSIQKDLCLPYGRIEKGGSWMHYGGSSWEVSSAPRVRDSSAHGNAMGIRPSKSCVSTVCDTSKHRTTPSAIAAFQAADRFRVANPVRWTGLRNVCPLGQGLRSIFEQVTREYSEGFMPALGQDRKRIPPSSFTTKNQDYWKRDSGVRIQKNLCLPWGRRTSDFRLPSSDFHLLTSDF